MQISRTTLPMPTVKAPAAPAAQEQNAETSAPKESFSFSGSKHYSGSSVIARAAGGALTGLGAHYFGDGSIGGTAKLGAMINGGVGATIGGLTGALAGGVTAGGGGALIGAAGGAAIVGIPMAVGGAIKGALIGVVGTALGGGPVAFAGSGALLGAIGL